MKKAIIVGAGLSAATAATILVKNGYSVEVFETRPHIAGNCYDSEIKGVRVHNYGPHGFHTDDDRVWKFVNNYDTFNSFRLRVNARLSNGNVINIPYNLNTQDIVGEWSPDKIINELFIPYSEKHWGCKWEELPSSITARVPKKRQDRVGDYHLDKYQGVPKSGYTQWIKNMFEGCKVHTGCSPNEWKKHKADIVIYTGSIDAYYDYEYGPLEYRSLRFEFFESEKTKYHQLNECNTSYKRTRTIDHSHWYDQKISKTVCSKEYPEEYNKDIVTTDRFYPKCFRSQKTYNKYKSIPTNTVFLGRLGTYKYLDMDDCIKQVFTKLKL
jgi:UDP-galactopyranose mutase